MVAGSYSGRNPKDLHHFVAQMVDDLDSNPPGCGFGEGAGDIAVQGRPGVFVDFGFERGFKGLVGIAGAEKIGVADEEGLHVVVGVDEPARYSICTVAADFAGVGVEHIDAVDLDPDVAVGAVQNGNIGFAEDDEQVAFIGGFEVVDHVQVGIHPGFKNRDAAQFGKIGRTGVVVEGTGDEDIKISIAGFAGGGD